MRFPLKDTFLKASVRKRLWIGAGAVAVFIGTLLIAAAITPVDPHDQGKVGLDFIAFYTAGHFVRDGRSADLYDIGKVHEFQSELARKNGVDLGSAVGPWWNPPFYAWVFVPIAKYSYRDALKYWEMINIACAAIAAWVLCSWVAQAARPCLELQGKSLLRQDTGRPPVPHGGWRSWLLVPVLMLLSMPFIHALTHAQNTCTSLLIFTVGVVFWRKQRAVAAGLVTGLLFYKPQLGVVLTAVLVLSLGWRALIGLAITGMGLLLASLALPGSLTDFLHKMPRNVHFVQCVVVYMWDRHVTYKAFWRLLFQGFAVGEPRLIVTVLATLCSASVGVGLLWAALRVRRSCDTGGPSRMDSDSDIESAARRDRLIAATIASTPLLMPFYFDYDQLLLVIPAVLLATDLLRRDRSLKLPFTDRWLMRIWPVQYVWMMFNPDIATLTHVNLGVLLLTAVTGLLIARAGRIGTATALRVEEPQTYPALQAA